MFFQRQICAKVKYFSPIYRIPRTRCISANPRLLNDTFTTLSVNDFNVPDNFPSGMTVASAEQFWVDKLCRENVPEAKSSIQHILAHILGLKSVTALGKVQNRKLNDLEQSLLLKYGELKRQRMPVQYIIGEWDFLELTIQMCHSPPVFIPRPETEDLVGIISNLISDQIATKCLEIGCGTGAISLALCNKHTDLTSIAIDANPAAVSLATKNAVTLKLTDRASFWMAQLEKDGIRGVPLLDTSLAAFDIVVSNPPYIPTSEISLLAPEVSMYEPHLALDGGPDGTRVIEMILRHAPQWLRSKGILILEIDPRQIKKINSISKEIDSYSGQIEVRTDCFGVERFVVLTKK